MASRLTGDWKRVDRLFKRLPEVLQKNLIVATRRSALHIKKAMKLGIVNTRPEWPALKPATIKRKGSSKPLIDHADLLHGINARALRPTMCFIGVHRNEKKKDGTGLVSIAAVHEFGYPRGGIPARPFVHPALEESKPECMKEYKEAIESGLKDKLYYA